MTSARGIEHHDGVRRLLAPAVFAALLAGGPAHAQASLRIATEGAYPPFNYVENDEPAGFEIELAKALCAAMKLPCTFQLQDWDSMHAGLKAGRYDAIVSSMEVTDERRRRYTFSKPYYRIPSALVGLKSRPDQPKTPDLAGSAVGVVEGSEFAAFLESRQPGPDIRTYARLDEANLDLLTGRIDYVLGDKLALSTFLGTREGKGCCRMVADLPVDRGGGYAVALRLGDNGLRDLFDRALDQVVADGSYDRIRAKYVPFDIK